MDNVLIANESVEDYSQQRKKGLVLKLDLEKAYDFTDWDFLDYIMARRALVVNGDHGSMAAL